MTTKVMHYLNYEVLSAFLFGAVITLPILLDLNSKAAQWIAITVHLIVAFVAAVTIPYAQSFAAVVAMACVYGAAVVTHFSIDVYYWIAKDQVIREYGQ